MATISSLMPLGQQPLSDAGVVIPGGKLYFYQSGSSSVAQDTYNESGAANANPVILDSAGRCKVYGGAAPYRVIFKDASDNLLWTEDPVYAPATSAIFSGYISATGLALTELVDSGYSGSPGGVQLPYVISGAAGVNPPYAVVVFAETAALDIGTLSFGTQNGTPRAFFWTVKTAYTVTWRHNYTPSTSGIYTDTSRDVIAQPNSMGFCYYDADSQRWRVTVFNEGELAGTWTPSTSALVNCSALVITNATYRRNGSLVWMSLYGTVTVTSTSTAAGFTFTLPVTAATGPKSIGSFFYGTSFNVGVVAAGSAATTAVVTVAAVDATVNGAGLNWQASLVYAT